MCIRDSIFPRCGDTAQAVDDQAAHGIEIGLAVLVLIGRFQAEGLEHFLQVRAACGNKPVLGGHKVLVLVVKFVLDVAHDLLQDVLHRGKSAGAAVFVHHHGDLRVDVYKRQPSIQAAVKPLFSFMRPFARPRLYSSTASAASAARHRSVHQGACAKMRRKP